MSLNCLSSLSELCPARSPRNFSRCKLFMARRSRSSAALAMTAITLKKPSTTDAGKALAPFSSL